MRQKLESGDEGMLRKGNNDSCSKCGGKLTPLIEVETDGSGLKHVRYLNKCRLCGTVSILEELVIRRDGGNLEIYVKR